MPRIVVLYIIVVQSCSVWLYSQILPLLPANNWAQRSDDSLHDATHVAQYKKESCSRKPSIILLSDAKEYDDGDPTSEEQYMLELINRTRANPAQEGVLLAETTDPDVVEYYTIFHINTDTLRADFQRYKPLPPLAFHPQLLKAAREHTADMVAYNYQAHKGTDSSDGGDRAIKYGYKYWYALSENVYSYCRSLWHGHAGMLVDWGDNNQVELGHRDNILNFTHPQNAFNEVGIGVGVIHNAQSFQRVGPYVVTQLLAKSYDTTKQYIVGVVYNDTNGNNFYDIGEGIPNVYIRPDSGEYYAVTGISGGYAIPLGKGKRSVSIRAEGGVLSHPITQYAEMEGENRKVDFILREGVQQHPYTDTFSVHNILSITPHPVSNTSIIHYFLSHKTVVTFRLYDITGRECVMYRKEHDQGGTYSAYLMPYDGRLSDGMYYLCMETNEGTVIKKILFLEK